MVWKESIWSTIIKCSSDDSLKGVNTVHNDKIGYPMDSLKEVNWVHNAKIRSYVYLKGVNRVYNGDQLDLKWSWKESTG